MNENVICPYCGKEAEWVENKEIYGRNYGKSYMMYLCRKDDARVGTHNNTRVPLGTMANKKLRNWRMRVHAQLDPLWKSGKYKRGYIYRTISIAIGYEYHTGESTIETCKQVLELLPNLFREQVAV